MKHPSSGRIFEIRRPPAEVLMGHCSPEPNVGGIGMGFFPLFAWCAVERMDHVGL